MRRGFPDTYLALERHFLVKRVSERQKLGEFQPALARFFFFGNRVVVPMRPVLVGKHILPPSIEGIYLAESTGSGN